MPQLLPLHFWPCLPLAVPKLLPSSPRPRPPLLMLQLLPLRLRSCLPLAAAQLLPSRPFPRLPLLLHLRP